MKITLSLFSGLALCALASSTAGAKDWYPYPVQVWDPPFNMNSPRKDMDYEPLAKASRPWEICVSFPHMKDAYWLGVDYGVTEEAKDLGVKMQVVEAGGYTELSKQISQIEDCVAAGAQAVIIGAISYDGLNNLVSEIRAKNIPVIDVINGISSPKLSAKSLVSFGEMGAKTGEYLARLHPAGSAPVKVAWFPGPAGAGWVEAGNTGFTNAIKGSAIELVETKYGDTGKEAQSKLVEDTLEAHPDLAYIVGTAVTAEAAIPILRSRGLTDKIKVASYYFTPGVDRGLHRGQIVAAPTDSTVIQARIAVDQAVRILEGKPYQKHVGPALYVVTPENLSDFDPSSTLAPNGFTPVFRVD
ncbi:monosaccharide ABC transporter substrate-binding protein (CUT2 family) [Breoghania corrubedonensis]|uniref:Monosaccharide ABC transporter substrate-binding protein (CUT2 family) n=1 Tax=Breoghania corrubedonensis TaxID=665038 RepID=A0A2T5VGH6_9HYPH|nr:TMAO reductase system periplasmic protein TorT [Breoghania corrubedonensis]PTW62863.1 monosaccharide ABC transporter substrate-binding protein (CUT2 family) [Breoghania corrubedonensis]